MFGWKYHLEMPVQLWRDRIRAWVQASRENEELWLSRAGASLATYAFALAIAHAQYVAPGTGSASAAAVFCTDSGSTGDYSCVPVPAVGSYSTGLLASFKANTANSGAATLNLGPGIKPIHKNKDQDLQAGDIKAGQTVTVVYDGTAFQMQSQTGNFLEAGPAGAVLIRRTVYPWKLDLDTNFICYRNGACLWTGSFDLSGSLGVKPSRHAAADPLTCSEGESYYNTVLHKRRDCMATDVWADPEVNIPSLAGSGTGYACLTAAGVLFRSDTPCN